MIQVNGIIWMCFAMGLYHYFCKKTLHNQF